MLAAMRALSRGLAMLGGLVLVAIVVLTLASILGRAAASLGDSALLAEAMPWLARVADRLGPVPGDYELVEAGVGFAVFAFFPWCQINRGHATVDVFTARLGAGANRAIDLLAELLMTAVLLLIAWRLVIGTGDKFRNGETSFILQFPVWWAYAAATVAAAVAVLISATLVLVRVEETRTGRSVLGPNPLGGGHA